MIFVQLFFLFTICRSLALFVYPGLQLPFVFTGSRLTINEISFPIVGLFIVAYLFLYSAEWCT